MRRTPPRGLEGFSNPNRPDDARKRAIADAIDAIQADPVLAVFVAFLASLTVKRRRKAIWSFEFWWNELVPEDRSTVVQSYRPSATVAELARWSGLSERSLYRCRRDKEGRRAAGGDWPVGYKDSDGQLDAWYPDG